MFRHICSVLLNHCSIWTSQEFSVHIMRLVQCCGCASTNANPEEFEEITREILQIEFLSRTVEIIQGLHQIENSISTSCFSIRELQTYLQKIETEAQDSAEKLVKLQEALSESKIANQVLTAEFESNCAEIASLKNSNWLQLEFSDVQRHLESVIAQNVELHRFAARKLTEDCCNLSSATQLLSSSTAQLAPHQCNHTVEAVRRLEEDLRTQGRILAGKDAEVVVLRAHVANTQASLVDVRARLLRSEHALRAAALERRQLASCVDTARRRLELACRARDEAVRAHAWTRTSRSEQELAAREAVLAAERDRVKGMYNQALLLAASARQRQAPTTPAFQSPRPSPRATPTAPPPLPVPWEGKGPAPESPRGSDSGGSDTGCGGGFGGCGGWALVEPQRAKTASWEAQVRLLLEARAAEQAVIRHHLKSADAVICGLMRELHEERAARAAAPSEESGRRASAAPAGGNGGTTRPVGVPRLHLPGATAGNADGSVSASTVPCGVARVGRGGASPRPPISSPRPAPCMQDLAAHFPISTISEVES